MATSRRRPLTVRTSIPRVSVVLATALAVMLPLGLVFYQSFLNAPFFSPSAKLSLSAYEYVLSDPDFRKAFVTTATIAFGITAIAVPVGGMLAFLMVRTDLPGRGFLEPLLLIPLFVSPVVLAFGYVIAGGPVGFFSIWAKQLFGFIPWNIYSVLGLIVIGGLTHAPYVYIYSSSALRNLGSDLEEAARTAGAGPLRVALTVSLPMVLPALLFSGVLVCFLAFELFGLPLVLGDPEGILVLATYLYKLTNRLGVPSYQLMAVVVVAIMLVTLPLVYLQRRLLSTSGKYASIKGKGLNPRPLELGSWRWAALAFMGLWLGLTVIVPLMGVGLRSVVSSWGEGVNVLEVLTLSHFRELSEYPNVIRGITNTLLIAVIGGACSVVVYSAISLAAHRWQGGWLRLLDYLVLIPRAMPGLVAGLAFLWLFLFFTPLVPLRSTLFSVWLAYTVVWLAYGMRLISAALLQIGPELEEGARVAGATPAEVTRHVVLPLIRFSLVGSWVLVFLIFVRDYSTGVYLLGPGTEVIGSLLVSLWGAGAIDLIAALSMVNVILISAGLAIALRLGVRLHG